MQLPYLLATFLFCASSLAAFQNTITIIGNTNATAFYGVSYSHPLLAVGGNGPYIFSLASGSLPTGLQLASNGGISGAPSQEGVFNFLVRATDGNGGATGTQAFVLTVNAPYVTLSPSSAMVGVPYSATVLMPSLAFPYPVQIVSGTAPPGLTLNPNGLLSGTPTGFSATYSFGVRNAQSPTTFQYSLQVSGPAATTLTLPSTSLPPGIAGFGYSHHFLASGGTQPYTFSLQQGAFPPGLTLHPTGQLFGNLTTMGNFSFTIRVSDAASNAVSASFTMSVGAPIVQLGGGVLPNGMAGSNYFYEIRAFGGIPPLTYRYTDGIGLSALGLNLSTSGILSGIPKSEGSFSVEITASDSSGASATARFALNISRPNFTFTDDRLPQARANAPFEFTFSTQNGTAPVTFQREPGPWPPGMTIASNGRFHGTPTTPGSYFMTILATDALGFGSRLGILFEVLPARLSLTDANLPNATATQPYTHPLSAVGGQPPYRFALLQGALPSGITLVNPQGALVGLPITPGNYPFTLRITDSLGEFADRSFLLAVLAAPEPLSLTSTLAPASLYATYSASLSGRGGRSPYTYNLSGGTLPPGLRLGLDGSISGTPTTPGGYRFFARVTDAANATVQTEITFNILPASILPPATANRDYAASLPVPGPHSLLPSSFPLPTGLGVNAGASLQGRPLVPGIYGFALTNASTGLPAPYLLSVTEEDANASPNRIRTASLPPASTGLYYDQSIASDASSPRVFALSAGALPPGLTLDPNSGAIRGIPIAEGIHPFSIRVSTPNGLQSSQAYLLQVANAQGPRIHAVTSAASYEAGGVVPGELLTFFGDALGPQALSAAPVTRVAFDNQTAPLIYTQANQVSAIAPFALRNRGLTRLTIEYQGLSSSEFLLPVLPAKPALFAIDGSGQGPGAILNQDATVNSAANRAASESIVVLYATGGGSMTPEGIDGVLATATSALNLPVRVEVAGRAAEVLYAGNAPGLLHGVIQINVKLPSSLPAGLQPIRLEIGGRKSPAGISLWLR